MSLKNPVTPPGMDPGTQRLNHYATPGPVYVFVVALIVTLTLSKFFDKLLINCKNIMFDFFIVESAFIYTTLRKIALLLPAGSHVSCCRADRTLPENSVILCSSYVSGLVFLFWRLMLQLMQKISMEPYGNNPPTTATMN